MDKVSIVGIDIAKNTFHAHGAGADGTVVFRKALIRNKVLEFLADIDPCLVVIEACASAHHWGRRILALGHDVRLIAPQYVKPYVKRQKNDAADAEAIAEAASRPSMRFVAVKSAENQGQAMVLKTRDLLTRQRTQTINALRGHMTEHGLVAPKGPQHLPKLEEALRKETAGLPGSVVDLCHVLIDQIQVLTGRIDALTAQVRRIAIKDETAQRLTTIPGIGPITAVTLAVLAPPSESFSKGRDFSAWVGLIPTRRFCASRVGFPPSSNCASVAEGSRTIR